MSRHAAEKELLERDPERDAILDGISDALVILDGRTLEILEVNRSFLIFYPIRSSIAAPM